MNIIDLFSGVGGLSLGFEKAGFKTIAAVDVWEDAIKTYNHNHTKKTGIAIDIATFNKEILPNLSTNTKIDGVIGGPPCQGFSSARLSDNGDEINKINENRNKLYIDFFETVKKTKPSFFLIENVRGMAARNDGAFIKDIQLRFGSIGFKINFKVLNASDYGVPQNRHRVFIVGLKKNLFDFPILQKEKVSSHDALSDLPTNEYADKLDYPCSPLNDYQKLMRHNSKFIFNHEITSHSEQTIKIISLIPDGGSIKSLPDSFWKVRKFNKAFQRMNSSLPSLTIDTGHRNYFHYKENRVPTVREAARLQSFPDSFAFLGSKTSQYKQVGNAVPPLLAFEIAKRIKVHL